MGCSPTAAKTCGMAVRPFSVRKLSGRRVSLVLITYEHKEREHYAKHARVLVGYLG